MLRLLQERALARVFGQLLSGERGVRRFKLAGLAIAANIVSKALGFLVIIYSTRVALALLGTERFGVWVTIASIPILLGFMDMGVSNALIGRVAQVRAGDKSGGDLKKLVSGSLTLLMGIGIVAAVILLAVFASAPLAAWFKGIGPAVVAEARLSGMVFAILFGLSIPAQGVLKIYAGIQHGWVGHLASAAGWAVSLLLLALSKHGPAPMWFFLFATYGIQQLAGILLALALVHADLLGGPGQMFAGAKSLRKDTLFKQGQLFFTIQIAFALAYGANQFILSSMLGPSESAAYGVLQRYFMIVQVALTIVNLPLWAMYADAWAHDEPAFVSGLLRRSMLLTVLASAAGVTLLVLMRSRLLPILAGNHIDLGARTVMLMALWTVIEACGISFSMYLNGLGRIRPQAVLGTVHTVAGLPAKIVAVKYFGLDGMILGIIVSYMAFIAFPLLTIYRKECFDTSMPSAKPT